MRTHDVKKKRCLFPGLAHSSQEPTYREVLVVYRAAHNRMAPARQRRHRSDDEELGADGRPGSAGADSRPDAGEGGQQGQQQEQQGRRRRRRRSRGFRSGWLRRLFLGQPEEEVAVRRPTVQLRIYRDIPVRGITFGSLHSLQAGKSP